MKNLNNLHMTARPHSAMIGVGWEADNGDRMHVWLEVAKNEKANRSEPVSPYRVKIDRPMGHKIAKAIVYRNCALSLKREDAGYFGTRYLDANASANAPVVAEALRRAEAEGMFEKALADHERQDAEKEAKERAEYAASMRRKLNERRGRLIGMTRPQALNLIDAMIASSDDDILEFSNL